MDQNIFFVNYAICSSYDKMNCSETKFLFNTEVPSGTVVVTHDENSSYKLDLNKLEKPNT